MTSATLSTGTRQQFALRKIPVAALIGGIVGTVGNVLLYLIAQAAGVVFEIPLGSLTAPVQPLPVMAIVIFSVLPAIGAGVLFALLVRFLKQPLLVFYIISGVFLVVSFIPTFSLPVPSGIQISLALMHVVSAAAIVWALVTRTRA